jgi:hypothetical protein
VHKYTVSHIFADEWNKSRGISRMVAIVLEQKRLTWRRMIMYEFTHGIEYLCELLLTESGVAGGERDACDSEGE